jgi:drug/metabolite transporter (DMT)-like permease
MQPLRGIALKVMAVFMFMGMASLIKAASADVPPGQAVFFRSFFALPIILGWLAMRGELRHGWKTDNPVGHFLAWTDRDICDGVGVHRAGVVASARSDRDWVCCPFVGRRVCIDVFE